MEMKISESLPLVSVVISTYYNASTIGQVLEALLKQNYPLKRIEIVIVNGASNDDTIKIVKMQKTTLIYSMISK